MGRASFGTRNGCTLLLVITCLVLLAMSITSRSPWFRYSLSYMERDGVNSLDGTPIAGVMVNFTRIHFYLDSLDEEHLVTGSDRSSRSSLTASHLYSQPALSALLTRSLGFLCGSISLLVIATIVLVIFTFIGARVRLVAFCGRPSVRSLALVPLILSILFNLLGTLLFLLIPNALSSDAVGGCSDGPCQRISGRLESFVQGSNSPAQRVLSWGLDTGFIMAIVVVPIQILATSLCVIQKFSGQALAPRKGEQVGMA